MNCPVCASQEHKLKERSGSFAVLACGGCGLVFSDPMSAGDAEYYENVTEYNDKWEFKSVPDYLNKRGITGSLLDLGCGDGRFLESVHTRFRVAGLDFNPAAVRTARSQRRVANVYEMTLADFLASSPGAAFDVICAFHILEHMADPLEFLRGIKACMKEDGVLALAVPNPGRWALRFGRETWDRPPHHLTRWNEHALCAALERAGLQVIEIYREPVETFAQVVSGFQDVVWARVLKNFSFGIASRLKSQAPAAEPGREDRTSLRDCLVKAKNFVIRWTVFSLSAVFYPFLKAGRAEGKTLLVFARPA